ncbi:transcriptional Coactivator p15-domain-containing protein [Chlamydoabsidia padenii]|nr:transcriptional Coactivator p15-domain-containing protein [Chlamydoabsidia padenii]
MPKRSRESDSESEEDKDFNANDSDSADEEPKKTAPKKAKKEESSKGERNENGEEYFVLSGKRRITIRSFQGKKCVDLREYYQTKDSEYKPTSKGLLLPLDQFKRFVELIPQVEDALERL